MKIPDKINIREKSTLIKAPWSPKILAELNGQEVKLAKFHGEFTWHKHEDIDELFLVIEGQITVKFPEKAINVEVGELIVIPKGLQHCPMAEGEAVVLIFEPKGTLNTGDQKNKYTVENIEKIGNGSV